MDVPTFLACQPYLHLLRNGTSTAFKSAWPSEEEMKESSQKNNDDDNDDQKHCPHTTLGVQDHHWTVLTDQLVSIEPVAKWPERRGRHDGHGGDGDVGMDDVQEEEAGGTNPRSLGPAFFIPSKPETTIGKGADTTDHTPDAEFDFGQFHMELALFSPRSDVSSVKTTPLCVRRQYPSTTNNDDDDADAILFAKIDDRFIYQINLECLQRLERIVHEENNDVPSCLVLHFPGCSFRIFGTSSTTSSCLLKDSSSSAGTGTSSSTEVVDKVHRSSKPSLDETRDAIYAALKFVIRDSDNLHLPFPLEDDVSATQEASGLDRSVKCRQAHDAAFTDIFELKTILGSTVSKDLTKSTASTLKERLNSLLTSIPSHAASSFCTKEVLWDTVQQYSHAVSSKHEELEETLEMFWNSTTSTLSTHGHHQSKRRRLFIENVGSTKKRSPTESSSPSRNVQKQQDCMQQARELLKRNKQLLSSKYELLALPQR